MDLHSTDESAALALDPGEGCRPSFTRLLLVSALTHLHGVPVDDDTLVIAFDWLLWRQAVGLGHQAQFFETGLLPRAKTVEPWEDMYVRAARWVYRDGADCTIFRGVSLGKQFTKDVCMMLIAAERLTSALSWFCDQYRVRRIELRDIRYDLFPLDEASKRKIVESVAVPRNIEIVDRLAPPSEKESCFSLIPPYGRKAAQGAVYYRLRRLYSRFADFVTRMVAPRGLPHILALPVGHMFSGLMQALPRRNSVPMLLAERSPKGFRFLLACMKNRVILADARPRALDGTDLARMAEIKASISMTSDIGLDGIIADYVARCVIGAGRFEERAAHIKRWQQLFVKYPIHQVLVSGSIAAEPRSFMELTRAKGGGINLILHGLRTCRERTDSLCGDGVVPPLVQRIFAWGPQNVAWAEATGIAARVIRSGFPTRAATLPPTVHPERTRKVLVLPFMAGTDDFFALEGQGMCMLVEILRYFIAAGMEARLKLHPGLPNQKWFERVMELHGLDVIVHKAEPIGESAKWADIVVGPANTSAMVPIIEQGQPYYSYLPPPTAADPKLMGGIRPAYSLAELLSDIENHRSVDPESFRALFSAFDDVSDPAEIIWSTMEA